MDTTTTTDQQQQAEAVREFCAVTSSTPEQARFFLESCTWRLDSALHSYFESAAADNIEDDVDEPVMPHSFPGAHEQQNDISSLLQPPRAASVDVQRASAAAAAAAAANNLNRPDRMVGSRSARADKKPARVSSGNRGGIKTLSDLNKPQDSDSDSDGPQEYYTGGEKSGMMVQDPSKGQRDIDSIFERARQFGAKEGNLEAPSASSGSRGAFFGTARTLTGDIKQDQEQVKEEGARPESVVHTITFWRNGFTVDDGPLRKLEDRENAPFIESINRGECPAELEPSNRSTAVHVNLVKKDEEWQPPAEPRYRAFQGTGRTLGGASQPPSAASASQSSISSEVNAQPFQGLVVDDSKPSTLIQLRLSDGTRMVARFNHDHTIADIRGFIDAARPGSARNYQLQTMGFPPKLLLNSTETVAQAGLLNAVVIQKV